MIAVLPSTSGLTICGFHTTLEPIQEVRTPEEILRKRVEEQVTSHPELKRKLNDGYGAVNSKIHIVQGLESKLPAAMVTADFSGFFDSSDDDQAMDTRDTNRAEKYQRAH